MIRSRFHQVDRNIEHNIVFIEDDCELYNAAIMSVTNDAENVVTWFRELYGNGIRIVYRDTNNIWSEIVWHAGYNEIFVSFRPWAGLAWDILSKKEQV